MIVIGNCIGKIPNLNFLHWIRYRYYLIDNHYVFVCDWKIEIDKENKWEQKQNKKNIDPIDLERLDRNRMTIMTTTFIDAVEYARGRKAYFWKKNSCKLSEKI